MPTGRVLAPHANVADGECRDRPEGQPGQRHFSNGLPAAERLVSLGGNGLGVRTRFPETLLTPAMAIFPPGRRLAPNRLVPALRCLASDTGHKLWISIMGSSSGDA